VWKRHLAAQIGVLGKIAILNVALLRLRFQFPCGLDLNHNLPFLQQGSEF
jgi:hypothetical protein